MRLLLLIAALFSPLGAAHSAEILEGGALLDPDAGPSWVITPDGDDDLPDGLTIAGRTITDITVHRIGVLIIDDDGSVDPAAPAAFAGLRAGGVIAPLWAELQAGPCPETGEVVGEVRQTATETGVRFTWRAIPLAGCPAGDRAAATFSVELILRGDELTALELRYGALPSETMAVEPRAGYRLLDEHDASVAFELLPDPEAGVQRGRAKLLAEGSSDGDAGAWIIELDAAGHLVGDPDADGRRSVDNCEDHFNPLQENHDDDDAGDACDDDDDDDGLLDVDDNCERVAGANQRDLDGDGAGDICDADDDGDGLIDGLDRCPRSPDPANHDLDRDGRGDVCDRDADGDDWLAGRWGGWQPERCPLVFDPWRGDADGDGIGDTCDLRPFAACRGDCAAERDSDGDRISDAVDLCPRARDREQRDGDGDGLGDACDPDRDNDGVLDIYQLCDFGGCDPVGPMQLFGERIWR